MLAVALAGLLVVSTNTFSAAQTWNADFTRGQDALNSNKFSQAEQLFNKCVSEANEPLDNQQHLVEGLTFLGSCYMQQGQYSRANEVLHRAMLAARKLGQGNDPVVLQMLVDSYTGSQMQLMQLKLSPAARAAYKKLDNADVAYQHKDISHAEGLYKEALAQADLAGNQRVKAEILFDMIAVYGNSKQQTTVEHLLHQALPVCEHVYGQDSGPVAECLLSLANIEAQKNNLAAAESLYLKGLKICQAIDEQSNASDYVPEDPAYQLHEDDNYYAGMLSYADLLKKTGKADQSRQMVDRANNFHEKQLSSSTITE